MKKYFGKDWYKIYGYRMMYICIFLFTIFSVDMITKYVVAGAVDWQDNTVASNWGIIRWQFLQNPGTTIFNNMNLYPSSATLLSLNIIIIIFLLTLPLFFSNKVALISIALLLAGTMGNTLDRMIKGYVIDVINIPWLKNGELGTFNLADVSVAIGSVVFGINMAIVIWKSDTERKGK